MNLPSRKVRLLCLLLFTLFLAAAILLPQLLEQPGVQRKIREIITSNAPGEISVNKISLEWLPQPHIKISHIYLKSPEFIIKAPCIELYPDLLWPVHRRNPVKKAVLESPKVNLISYSPGDSSSLPLSLLPEVMTAHDATVVSNAGIFLPGLLLGDRKTTFRECDLEIRFSRDKGVFKVNFEGRPGYADSLQIEASLHTDLERFSAWAKVQHLDLNSLFSHYIHEKSVPVTNNINLFLSIDSTKPGFYNATLNADTPCIILGASQRRKIEVSCGVLSMDVAVTPDSIDASVLQCDLKNPRLNLSGKIHLDPPDNQQKTDQKGRLSRQEALWDIGLQARDVDIEAVRGIVLNLFGKNPDVREVCHIVRGGRADTLEFKFKGTTSQLEHLDRMLITAQVDKVPVYIPDPDLFLDEASGSIVIRDGILYGKGLSARIGNSQGWNGTIELGLSNHLFDFRLDLDLRADVTELKPILERLIEDRDIVNEIKKFRNVKGTVLGHLSIGHDLKDFDVFVKIEAVDAAGFYERLGWPVNVSTGKADITPDSVIWHDIKGKAGKSSIARCSGKITWKGVPELNISKLSARIDTRQLISHLLSYPLLKKQILPVVTQIDGILALHSASLKGPASMPEKWRYTLNASPVSISVKSPLLPEDTSAVSGKITLSDTKLLLSSMQIKAGPEPLFLDGALTHQLLQHWRGKIQFHGQYGRRADQWVVRNGWRSQELAFSVPCLIKKSVVEFYDNSAHFKGDFLFRKGKPDQVSFFIDRYVTANYHDILLVRIESLSDSIVIFLDSLNPERGLFFSVDGRLTRKTVNTILAKKDILKDKIQGSFACLIGEYSPGKKLKYSAKTNSLRQPGFRGSMEIRGLNWLWGTEKPFVIDSLSVSGSGNIARITNSEFDFSRDILNAQGTARASSKGLELDLDINSDLFHLSSLPAVKKDTDDKTSSDKQSSDTGEGDVSGNTGTKASLQTETERESESMPASHFKIWGKAGFYFKTFINDTEPVSATIEGSYPKKLSFSDISGNLRLYPDGALRTDVLGGMLCGMQISGAMLAPPDSEIMRSFVVKTPDNTENNFEDISSCLGIDTDVLQGALKVDVAFDMNGTAITAGHVDFDAHDGKLKRFTMLSRIFSIINLVDFLGKKGWNELAESGLAYSKLNFRSIINHDELKIEKAAIYGNGLNLFATGSADIDSRTLDLMVIVAPLKTLDAIVTNIPFIGKGFGGEHKAFITIPVSVKGDMDDPEIKVLPVKTFTDMIGKLIAAPIKGPFDFLKNLANFGNKDHKVKRPGGSGIPPYHPVMP